MAKIRVGPEILSRQGAETGRRYRDRRLEEGAEKIGSTMAGWFK